MELYDKSIHYGATNFGISNRKNKRFYVVYNGKYIHFGSKNGTTYYDKQDDTMKKNWKARHSKIVNKLGVPFYTIKTSPEFWSWHLLWN